MTGKRRRNFTTKEKALEFARQIAARVEKSGLDSINIITDPRIKSWTTQAAIYNRTLEEVFNLGLQVCAKAEETKISPYMAELLTLWVDDRATDKLEPIRPRSLKGIKSYANIFKNDFGMVKMSDITQSTVEDYLSRKNVSNTTRKNLKNYLGQFFRWTIRKHYHNANPVANIVVKVQQGQPQFFTVPQCEEIMELVSKEEHRPIANYFALCLFAGIRPEEAERMTFANINFDTNEIHIPAEISKTKKSRLFTINTTLLAWLNHNKDIRPLIPANVKKMKSAIFNGLSFPWLQDGLRHSFATYHYAQYHSLEELRHIMGNSARILERHYKGVIPAAEVEKFWSIKF